MSTTTLSRPETQAQAGSKQSPHDDAPVSTREQLAALEATPMYQACRPVFKSMLRDDMYQAVAVDGLPLEEYIEGINTWGTFDPDTQERVNQGEYEAFTYLQEGNHIAEDVEYSPLDQEPPAPVEPEVSRKFMAEVDRVVRYWGKGEAYLRDNLLLSGKHADKAIVLGMAQGMTRPAIKQVLEGKLVMTSGKAVDVDRVIKTYYAVELLANGTDYSEMPYRVLQTFETLVDRNANDNTYGVDPKLLDGAVKLFAHVAAQHIDRDGCRNLVRALKDPNFQPKPKAAPAPKADDKPEAAPVAATGVDADTGEEVDTQETETTTAPAAPAGKPDERGTLTNLLKTAKAGTSKDVAGMAAELLLGGDAPDDAVLELLILIHGNKDLHKSTRAALDAALLLLNREQVKESQAA